MNLTQAKQAIEDSITEINNPAYERIVRRLFRDAIEGHTRGYEIDHLDDVYYKKVNVRSTLALIKKNLTATTTAKKNSYGREIPTEVYSGQIGLLIFTQVYKTEEVYSYYKGHVSLVLKVTDEMRREHREDTASQAQAKLEALVAQRQKAIAALSVMEPLDMALLAEEAADGTPHLTYPTYSDASRGETYQQWGKIKSAVEHISRLNYEIRDARVAAIAEQVQTEV